VESEITKPAMYVEGTDDEHVSKHIMDRHSVLRPDREIRFMHGPGREGVLRKLKTEIKGSSTAPVGFVLDADEDAPALWSRIRDMLRDAADWDGPGSLPRDGLIASHPVTKRRFGIWIMPNNQDPGTVEELLLGCLDAEDDLVKYAHTAVEEARRLGARVKEQYLPKARLHTWLAWQEEPGKPYGVAIRANYIVPHVPDAVAFAKWCRRLLFDPDMHAP